MRRVTVGESRTQFALEPDWPIPEKFNSTASNPTPAPKSQSKETIMPFARIDLIKGKSTEYRTAVADIV
jgi:hypothetical protein